VSKVVGFLCQRLMGCGVKGRLVFLCQRLMSVPVSKVDECCCVKSKVDCSCVSLSYVLLFQCYKG
jgi:hypothetical protein